MSYVLETTISTMQKAIKGLSGDLKCNPSDVRIIIAGRDGDKMPDYFIRVAGMEGQTDENGLKVYPRAIQFKNLIYDKIDWFNKAETAPLFIAQALKRVTMDEPLVGKECKGSDLSVLICAQTNDTEINPCLFLFKNGQQVKQLSFEYFIQGED